MLLTVESFSINLRVAPQYQEYIFFQNSLKNFTSTLHHSKAPFLYYNMFGDENNTPRRELTNDQQSEIIGAYKCGVKGSIIIEKLGLSSSTVYDTIDRYNKTGSP